MRRADEDMKTHTQREEGMKIERREDERCAKKTEEFG